MEDINGLPAQREQCPSLGGNGESGLLIQPSTGKADIENVIGVIDWAEDSHKEQLRAPTFLPIKLKARIPEILSPVSLDRSGSFDLKMLGPFVWKRRDHLGQTEAEAYKQIGLCLPRPTFRLTSVNSLSMHPTCRSRTTKTSTWSSMLTTREELRVAILSIFLSRHQIFLAKASTPLSVI